MNKADVLTQMSKAQSLDDLPWKDNEAARKLRASVENYSAAAAGFKMRPYQEAACVNLIYRMACLLADEMGVGKTPESICAAELLGLERVLIITPKSCALGWRNEIKTWCGRDAEVYLTKSKKQDPTQTGWYVVPWSQAAARADELITSGRWDVVIIDESHYAKTRDTQRTVAVFGQWKKRKGQWVRIKGLVDVADRKWCLTGTPIKNKPIDLYPTLRALDAGRWCASYDLFGGRYCKQMNRWAPRGYDYTGSTNAEELNEKLRGSVMVRRLKSEVMKDLPALQRTIIPMQADSTDLKKIMRKERELVPFETREQIRQDLGKGKTPGFEFVSELRKELGVAKIPMMVKYALEQYELTGEPLIVCAYHKDVIEGIAKGLNDKGVETSFIHGSTSATNRDKIIKAFGSQYQILVVSIPACGTGVNGLQTVTQLGIIAELDWSQSSMWQMEGRLHRYGQQGSVNFHYVLLEDSLDAYMLQTILAKDETEQEILK